MSRGDRREAGILRFQWKVSSQDNYDWLKFSLDGVELAKISGTTDWAQCEINILTSGPQTLRWTYVKNGIVSSGLDAGWLEAVSFDIRTSTVPVITQEPQSRDVPAGTNVSFSVMANGFPSPSYAWYFNGAALANVTNTTLVLANVQSSQAGGYYAIASNVAGTATSQVATLTVRASPPVVLTQPASQTVIGNQVMLSVGASGTVPLSYQWLLNGNPVAGATNPNLSFTHFQMADAGLYAVAISNVWGSVTSTPAVLTVGLMFTRQPQSQAVAPGSTVLIEAQADGQRPISYQWLSNNVTMTGATNAFLILSNVTQEADYSVRAINPLGNIQSQAAWISIEAIRFKQIGEWQGYVPGDAQAVAVVGHYAYLCAGYIGLVILDISDPNHPLYVGGYDTSGWAYGVQVVGNYAYVADDEVGFQVIDVIDPANPKRVGGYDTKGEALNVWVVGEKVYVADGSWGLSILQIVPLEITSQPSSQQVMEGDAVRFGVSVVGTGPFFYQWYFNGAAMTHAMNAILELPNVPSQQAGVYYVVVSNAIGAASSQTATLTVVVPLEMIVPQEYRSGEEFRFVIEVPQGMRFRIEGSEDLRNWQEILITNWTTTAPYEFRHDDPLRYECRFYRAVLLP